MRNDHIPALSDHIGDVSHRIDRCIELILHRFMLIILDEGVPANRNNCQTFIFHIYPLKELRFSQPWMILLEAA